MTRPLRITIVEYVHGLRGDLHVTLEEGAWVARLYDLLRPYVNEVLVYNPRKNALLKVGNKSDRIDARKLAELLHGGQLSSVYHGEHGVRALKELARSYLEKYMGRTYGVWRLSSIQPTTNFSPGMEKIGRWV